MSVLQKCVLQICSIYTGKHPFRSVSSVKLQTNPFDEHLRRTTSANFNSTCLPYFSVQIRAKFVVLSNVFLTSLMFSSERAVLHLPEFSMFPEFSLFLFRLVKRETYFITFCWIVFLHGVGSLNPYLSAA